MRADFPVRARLISPVAGNWDECEEKHSTECKCTEWLLHHVSTSHGILMHI